MPDHAASISGSTCDKETSVMMQEAMEPEAVASGLVTRENFCTLWKAELRLGASDVSQDRYGVAGRR